MAKILYQPHCSNCGAVISEEITVKESIIDLGRWYKKKVTYIEPFKCKVCGVSFESIEIRPPR